MIGTMGRGSRARPIALVTVCLLVSAASSLAADVVDSFNRPDSATLGKTEELSPFPTGTVERFSQGRRRGHRPFIELL